MVAKDTSVMYKFEDVRWIGLKLSGNTCSKSCSQTQIQIIASCKECPHMFANATVPQNHSSNGMSDERHIQKYSVLNYWGKMCWFPLVIFVAPQHPQERLVVDCHCERLNAAREGPSNL